MHTKDYLTHLEKKTKDKRMQNRRLLKIIMRYVNRTYNGYGKNLKMT